MMITLPQDILDRVNRVMEYHRASKYTYDSVRQPGGLPDPDIQPSPYRIFDKHPKTALPTDVLDLPTPTLQLMAGGFDALAESQLHPPQNIKTLASWLYMADGLTRKLQVGRQELWLRTCTSAGAMYPYEIYVAAFAIDGLAPGLYHYSPREFALRKLREGAETLAQIKRGRPDLDYLKSVPAAVLVSTIFWRSVWKYRTRGYRYALVDAGHLVQNLITLATGLGIPTRQRLRMNDLTTRELIGLPADADFGQAEAVQAMVAWNENASAPLVVSQRSEPAPRMLPIEREPLSPAFIPDTIVVATHLDCVGPGVAVREVRPPLTELSPLAPDAPPPADVPSVDDPPPSRPLREVLLNRRSSLDFRRVAISRDILVTINRLALRGPTYFPLQPDGSHVALVRPFWALHDVTGMDSGMWYFDPPRDQWTMLGAADYRMEIAYLSMEQPMCGNASAVCFMAADLGTLMSQAGPDVYRLAHLEAGIAAQRLSLAAAAVDLSCAGVGAFYDDELRRFIGLEQTGWEILFAIAVGVPLEQAQAHPIIDADDQEDVELPWRG